MANLPGGAEQYDLEADVGVSSSCLAAGLVKINQGSSPSSESRAQGINVGELASTGGSKRRRACSSALHTLSTDVMELDAKSFPPGKGSFGAYPDVNMFASSSASARVPDGPQDLDGLHSWPVEFKQRLEGLGPDFIEELLAKAHNGVNFISDYSGAGCVEQAAAMIHDSLNMQHVPGGAHQRVPHGHLPTRHTQDSSELQLRCLRACDVDLKCQFVLRGHVGPLAPLHVFDNILSRVPAGVLEDDIYVYYRCGR